MSKNKRITRRHKALLELLAQGYAIETTLKRLRISPGRACQMLNSSRNDSLMADYRSLAAVQYELITLSCTAAAIAALRRQLADAKPENSVKAAASLLAKRRKGLLVPGIAPPDF